MGVTLLQIACITAAQFELTEEQRRALAAACALLGETGHALNANLAQLLSAGAPMQVS